MADPVELRVPEALDGERLDLALARLFGVSRAVAAGLVTGGVVLDGSVATGSTRVRTGQVIVAEPPSAAASLAPEAMDIDVLYEDEHLVVVDKPAGMVVHPGSGRSGGTLAAGLIHRYPELVGVGAEGRWGLVHRLDKDTSGALLVARDQPTFDEVVAMLRRREISRTYTALVEGRMGAPTGTIEAPIGRDPIRPTRRAVTPTGKHARTHFEVVRHYGAADASLLEVELETGRTHQIRVHMAAVGHPVAGDLAYGATRRDLGSPRTFLHASRVELTHPVTGERLTVTSPLPDDLAGVLARLEAAYGSESDSVGS